MGVSGLVTELPAAFVQRVVLVGRLGMAAAIDGEWMHVFNSVQYRTVYFSYTALRMCVCHYPGQYHDRDMTCRLGQHHDCGRVSHDS